MIIYWYAANYSVQIHPMGIIPSFAQSKKANWTAVIKFWVKNSRKNPIKVNKFNKQSKVGHPSSKTSKPIKISIKQGRTFPTSSTHKQKKQEEEIFDWVSEHKSKRERKKSFFLHQHTHIVPHVTSKQKFAHNYNKKGISKAQSCFFIPSHHYKCTRKHPCDCVREWNFFFFVKHTRKWKIWLSQASD